MLLNSYSSDIEYFEIGRHWPLHEEGQVTGLRVSYVALREVFSQAL